MIDRRDANEITECVGESKTQKQSRERQPGTGVAGIKA
jgi:hypothetical protein